MCSPILGSSGRDAPSSLFGIIKVFHFDAAHASNLARAHPRQEGQSERKANAPGDWWQDYIAPEQPDLLVGKNSAPNILLATFFYTRERIARQQVRLNRERADFAAQRMNPVGKYWLAVSDQVLDQLNQIGAT